MSDLNTKVWVRLAGLAIVMALLLFVPAGTMRYWQAWLYLAVFFGPAVFVTFYLMKHDPALLERRLRGGPTAEKEPAQKLIMFFACIGFVALLVVPALDARFGWSTAPTWVALLGDVLVAIGFYLTFLVYKENSFSAATIEIAPDHKVISTGPYARVRHPMYAGGLLYCGGTPLALGSYWGLLAFVAFVPVLVWRLLDEEKFLARNLPGYTDYQDRVRWCLIPGIF